MQTTLKVISEILEKVDSSFWGSIIIRIQKGEVVNIMKEQSIKIEVPNRKSGTKFAQ